MPNFSLACPSVDLFLPLQLASLCGFVETAESQVVLPVSIFNVNLCTVFALFQLMQHVLKETVDGCNRGSIQLEMNVRNV